MATSGSFTTANVGGIGSNYPRNATFNWWSNWQNIESNFSNISWNFVLGGGSSSRSTIGVYSGGVTVNGEYTSFNFGGSLKGNGTVLASGTKNIYHNDDGSRNFSASGSVNLYWSSGHSVSGSGSWWLTTIARAVKISSVSGSYTDENFSPTVKWANNGNRVDLKIEFPDLKIDPFKRWNSLQGSSSFKPTLTSAEIDELLAKLSSTNSTKVRFTIVTVIGGVDKFFSYIDKTFSIVNANPDFSYFSRVDSRQETVAVTGSEDVLVQNESSLVAYIDTPTIIAKPRKHATMSRYIVSCAGKTQTIDYGTGYFRAQLGTINATATQTIYTKAVDSRGNSTTATRTIPVLPYSKPVINLSASRKNNYENETTIKISGKYSPLSGKNTINATTGVQYRYKDSSTTNWSAWQNLTATFVNGSFEIAPFKANFDNNKSFNIEARATDRLNTTTVSVQLDRGIPIFRISTVDSKCYNNEKRMLVAGDNLSDLQTIDSSRTNTNDTPDWYKAKGVKVTIERKTQSALGLDGFMYGAWCVLITINDSDSPVQIVRAGGSWHDMNRSYIRQAYSGKWGVWRDIIDTAYTQSPNTNVLKDYGTIKTSTTLTMPLGGYLIGKAVILTSGSRACIEYAGKEMAGIPYFDNAGQPINMQVGICLPVTKAMVVKVAVTGSGKGQIEELRLVGTKWDLKD